MRQKTKQPTYAQLFAKSQPYLAEPPEGVKRCCLTCRKAPVIRDYGNDPPLCECTRTGIMQVARVACCPHYDYDERYEHKKRIYPLRKP